MPSIASLLSVTLLAVSSVTSVGPLPSIKNPGRNLPGQDANPLSDVVTDIKYVFDTATVTATQGLSAANHAAALPSAVYSAADSASSSSSGSCSYWLENIKHQGIASFNSNPSGYTVFRNVKDYGAKGDGVTDDTAAINAAISAGGRCAPGSCASSTTTPALVYFPAGTYIISTPIVDYYYTQLVGNANCLPVLKASSGFVGGWMLEGDPYDNSGNLAYGATNVFWRQVRNFVFDTTAVAPSTGLNGIHWPTGQASSLQNLVFMLSTAPGTQHAGIFIESGSGGFMTDLIFNGGAFGVNFGNQQFTTRNLTFNNVATAIYQIWDWGWTYQGITINNCQVGLNITSFSNGNQSVGSVTFLDSSISNTPVGVSTIRTSSSSPPSGGGLILENVALSNVPVAVQGAGGATLLAGTSGQTTIAGWGQGHSYTPSGPTVFQGPITPNSRPSSLLSGDRFYTRAKPQYQSLAVSSFISARDSGARGDGTTDDTGALQNAINSAASAGKILFLDAGYYKVTGTIYIPAGSKITGESYPVIMSSGSFFADMNNPQPVVQVGKSGESGTVEWSDTIVSSQGAQAGAIFIEYNLASSATSPTGLWDVHTRVGGFAGSQLQLSQCPKTPNTVVTEANLNPNCIAAFMSLHVTKGSTGLYLENVWLWVADRTLKSYPFCCYLVLTTNR
jgi:glucan 1,3-beta-glucosidase